MWLRGCDMAGKLRVAERRGTVSGVCIFIIFEAVCTNAKKHMAYRKKYKPCILKYKALILKYVPYIFALYKYLKNNNLKNL